MGISLSPFQPGAVNNQGGAPDALAQLLQAITQGTEIGVRGVEESGRNERASAQELGANSRAALQHKTDLANVALQQKEMDFKIAKQKSEQARIKMRGEAIRALLPWMQQMGQGQQAVDALGPEVGLTPSGGQSQWSDRPQQPQQIPMGPNGQPDIGAVLQGVPGDVIPGILEQLAQVTQIRQQATRDKIGAKYQTPPDETVPGMLTRLKKMSGDFAAAGDHAMVAALASDIGAIEPNSRAEQYEWFATKDGKTVYLPKEEGSRLRLGKPITTTGFGFGSAGPLGAMRAMSGIAGMQDADEKMRKFEIKAASGQVDYNSWDYFQGQLATLYSDARKETGIAGHLVPFFGTATGSVALAHLNRTNPELANYLQAASQWALEESLLSNRPSDFRTKMDEFVSAIKPSGGAGIGKRPQPNVQGIHDLWKSRAVRLDGYKKGVPALQAMFDRVVASAPGTTLEVLPTPP